MSLCLNLEFTHILYMILHTPSHVFHVILYYCILLCDRPDFFFLKKKMAAKKSPLHDIHWKTIAVCIRHDILYTVDEHGDAIRHTTDVTVDGKIVSLLYATIICANNGVLYAFGGRVACDYDVMTMKR